MNTKTKRKNRIRRHKRTRAKIKGTSERPRVCVYKSSRNIFVQFVDDNMGKTLMSNSLDIKSDKIKKFNKTETANELGKTLAIKAKDAGIKSIVFDSGGFKYHGRVKALAEGLRTGGLKF
jgi:large subunit ribosomal protein L18